MKKYLASAKIEWKRMTKYGLNILFFRIGNFFDIITQLIIWSIIYKTTDIVYGYTYAEMLTYVVIGHLFFFLTSNYDYETRIARYIQTGEISNMLCKPINLLFYIIYISFGKIYVTLFSSLFMQAIIIIFLFDLIIIPDNFLSILIVIFLLVVGYFIKLFLAILIGMLAFWTNYISGFQFSAKVFINFFSGTYFTLALLPAGILKTAMALPFAYTFFVPAQVYLGKMGIEQGVIGLFVSIIWLIILFILIKIIWSISLRKYESVGI